MLCSFSILWKLGLGSFKVMYQMITQWHPLCWLLINFPAGLDLFSAVSVERAAPTVGEKKLAKMSDWKHIIMDNNWGGHTYLGSFLEKCYIVTPINESNLNGLQSRYFTLLIIFPSQVRNIVLLSAAYFQLLLIDTLAHCALFHAVSWIGCCTCNSVVFLIKIIKKVTPTATAKSFVLFSASLAGLWCHNLRLSVSLPKLSFVCETCFFPKAEISSDNKILTN